MVRAAEGCPAQFAVCLSPANAVAEALNLDHWRAWGAAARARCAQAPPIEEP